MERRISKSARIILGDSDSTRTFRWFSWIGFTLLFLSSYTFLPLYSSNQNTYFLHGLAAAGVGQLRFDWLASTADPAPLFSLLVYGVIRWLAPAFFQLLHFILVGFYLFSLLTLIRHIFPKISDRVVAAPFLAVFLGLHSYVLDLIFAYFFHSSVGSVFHRGMADQYILGLILQPSAFGVLLLLGLVLYLSNRPGQAMLLTVFSVYWAPSYAFLAGLLVLGYMLDGFIQKRPLINIMLYGIAALLLVSPVLVYSYLTFPPDSSEAAQRAFYILAHERFPHHALVGYWFNGSEGVRLALIAGGLWVVRGKRIFPLLLVPAVGGLLLTLVQIVTRSEAIALLFPWRVSALLLPVCAWSLVAWGFTLILPWLQRLKRSRYWALMALTGFLTFGAVAGGGWLIERTHRLRATAKWTGATEFVHTLMNTGGGEGMVAVVPLEWEDFRIESGCPILVDQKSHPYKSSEVIEWARRIAIADSLYSGTPSAKIAALGTAVTQAQATHVVAPAGWNQNPLPLTELYRDTHAVVYQIDTPEREPDTEPYSP